MNNTDKLLRAFIEASGFEIEKLVDTKETPISKQSGLNRITSSVFTMKNSGLVVGNGGAFKQGDDECYYLMPSLDIDYKVTKKQDTALELLIEIINSDDDIANECFLGVGLFDRIKGCVNENNNANR